MKSFLTFFVLVLMVTLARVSNAQELVRPPDAPTAINAIINTTDYVIPQSQVPPDEFNKAQFRNIEGVETSVINQSWEGIFNNSTYRPPDSHGAAGPSGIIATVNLRVAYYTKTGTQTWIDDMAGAGNFFPSAVSGLSDPRALYDHDIRKILCYCAGEQHNTSIPKFGCFKR